MNPDIQKQLQDMQQAIDALKSNPAMPDHRHNGYDVSRIQWIDLDAKKMYVSHTIQSTAAATAANYGVFWIAPFQCFLSGLQEVHQTAGTVGGATVTLEKLLSGVALDSGSAMLASAISLTATANVPQTGVMGTPAVTNMQIGDRIAMKDSGTLTTVNNVTVVLEITML